MLVISNHMQGRMDFPENAIIRINMAWIESEADLEIILTENLTKDIFLDCPCGRSKPPKPVFMLNEAIAYANKFKNVKYFAISNVEDPGEFSKLKNKLRPGVKLVPKIETELGVKNIIPIMSAGHTGIAMLDKEDLYTDVQQDSKKYQKLVEEARKKCKDKDLILIELEGVIFAEHKE